LAGVLSGVLSSPLRWRPRDRRRGGQHTHRSAQLQLSKFLCVSLVDAAVASKNNNAPGVTCAEVSNDADGCASADCDFGPWDQVNAINVAASLATVVLAIAAVAIAWRRWAACFWRRAWKLRRPPWPEPPPLDCFPHEMPPTPASAVTPPVSPPPPGELLPSGVWRGYASYKGRRHDVFELRLDFLASGAVLGESTDNVGHYAIRGSYGQTSRRVAFAKSYNRGSANSHGRVASSNHGHSVEYKGELVSGDPGAGIRGKWSTKHALGSYEGYFHLWPTARSGAGGVEASHGSSFGQYRKDLSPPESQTVFQAAEGGECVVCYERRIATRLVPCGHVALCCICAERLVQRRCPICREPIASVEQAATFVEGLTDRDR